MEKLTVKNFLNLRNIELDLSKINILIGSQATGKSVIAKLIYFFKSFFLKYQKSIIENKNKGELDKEIIANFKEIFPEYSWNKIEWEITYFFEDYYIRLYSEKLLKTKYKLLLDYSEYLVNSRKRLIAKCRPNPANINNQNRPSSGNINEYIKFKQQVDQLFSQIIFPSQEENIKTLDNLTFIPAGRSFFANLRHNIFTFLDSSIDIDYFLKKFGREYEIAKRIYIDNDSQDLLQKENKDLINDLINKIIVGKYVYEKDQEWIYIDKERKINLLHSSSGQQEALPMVILLAFYPFLVNNQMFIIEEPEAHLFPTSQRDIINLMSLVFNLTEKKHKFFITTHSPYILTAFNNLIQAGNTLKALKEKPDSEELIKKLTSIIPENQMLDINDIGAYTLKDGMLESIINKENKLIDTNIIDEVSNEFSRIFEQLLDLEFGE